MQLIAQNLVVERGGRIIVDDLSFIANAGETLVLTGPNGAGKTTILRAIAGFLPLAGGQVRITPPNEDQSLVELIHMVGHANAVKAHLTVLENVRFWAEFLGEAAGAKDRADQALNAFALSDLAEYPVGYLSAGQRRRVGLARLVAAPRPIWLLDEPTVSLDAASTSNFARVVDAHTTGGGIAIAATHLPLGLAKTQELRIINARLGYGGARG